MEKYLWKMLNPGSKGTKTVINREDKGALAKLVEAVKTNYNDRYDEVRFSVLLALSFYTVNIPRREKWGTETSVYTWVCYTWVSLQCTNILDQRMG